MLNTYWKQFKSGTDIRGVASLRASRDRRST